MIDGGGGGGVMHKATFIFIDKVVLGVVIAGISSVKEIGGHSKASNEGSASNEGQDDGSYDKSSFHPTTVSWRSGSHSCCCGCCRQWQLLLWIG